ncbi:hypothetical protein [uncultured Clostridium sp.]|uniref:hypothetical protein n=1 Tax=uncultured Clostridium sp. TaxID=59620 RepID=UPI0026ED5BCF|nr:hypothetical protein [uncultured Clostridium sp.]
MGREEILDLIKGLSMSQGFYGRLLANMTEEYLQELVDQKFKEPLDMILYIEQ